MGTANGKCGLGKGLLLLHMNNPGLSVNRSVVLRCERVQVLVLCYLLQTLAPTLATVWPSSHSLTQFPPVESISN